MSFRVFEVSRVSKFIEVYYLIIRMLVHKFTNHMRNL